MVREDVETGPDVPLVVPGLHLHPATEADVLEESVAGVGAEVVVTNQDAHLPFQSSQITSQVLLLP